MLETIVLFTEFYRAIPAVLSPQASDTLRPLENIDKTHSACLLNGERLLETENPDGGESSVGDCGWLVGSNNYEGVGERLGGQKRAEVACGWC